MNINLEHAFPVSREALWCVLHDPERMVSYIPGCERLEETGPDRYAATLKVGVAAIKGTYTGSVQITDKQFPSRYSLTVEGSAAPGFVRGVATMELSEKDGTRTLLAVTGEAQVGGLIASVGQRLLTGIARQLILQMFQNIEREIARPAGEGGGKAL